MRTHPMNPGVRALVMAGLLAGVTARALGQPQEGKKPFRVEVIQGVEHLIHPQKCVDTGMTVRLELEAVYTGEDADGQIRTGRIDQFTVDDQGNVYLSEGANDVAGGFISQFDEKGRFIRSIGRKGQGPGELLQPVAFQKLADGRLIVLDARNFRTTYFDDSGTYLSSHGWRRMRLGPIYADTSIYLGRERGNGVMFNAFTHDGHMAKPFFKYRERELQQSNDYYGTIPFSPYSLIAVDPGASRIYHSSSGGYQIEVYDLSGQKRRVIERDYRRIPITKAFIQAYCDGLQPTASDPVQRPIGEILKSKVQWPSHFPAIAGMTVDDQGRLWVETHEVQKNEGRTLRAFDLYSREGDFLTRTWLDLSAEKSRMIKKGKLYSLETDEELGMHVVKRYRIIWENRKT